MEQGHQQLKEELGRDHFEGQSWRGFHHHAAMALLYAERNESLAVSIATKIG